MLHNGLLETSSLIFDGSTPVSQGIRSFSFDNAKRAIATLPKSS
jgi:hypothetical protein